MPSIPSLIKKMSFHDLRHRKDSSSVNGTEDNVPPVPQNPQKPSIAQGLSMTFNPDILVSVSGLSLPKNVPPQNLSRELVIRPAGTMIKAEISKTLPETPTAPTFSEISKNIDNFEAGKNKSKMEKSLDKAGPLITGAVAAGTETTGMTGMVKNIIANETVQTTAKAVASSIPVAMGILEKLSKTHAFLALAFIPFQAIYNQEQKKQENDTKRHILYLKIRDVMFLFLELQGTKPESRVDADGQPIMGRLETVCTTMRADILECHSVLYAQETQSWVNKFLHASRWNEKLKGFLDKFEETKRDVGLALSVHAAKGIDHVSESLEQLAAKLTGPTPQDRIFMSALNMKTLPDDTTRAQVIGDDIKCQNLLELQKAKMSNRQTSGNPDYVDPKDELKALRRDFHQDINIIVKQNLDKFTQRFTIEMDRLRDNLDNSIKNQGDRIIDFMGGPLKRLEDKIIYHVWKDQGWKGSAKTRSLVLSLRDYFVERFERNRGAMVESQVHLTQPGAKEDDPDDTERIVGQPLEDDWIIPYLDAKGLIYLQSLFDPNLSGFATISEVNSFTGSKPQDWSLPKWVVYWTTAWPMFASRYCKEIEDIIQQMFVLRHKITRQMGGNKSYVDHYLLEIWPSVNALTDALDRVDMDNSIFEHYQEYVLQEEQKLGVRLDRIKYDIDFSETVDVIIGDQRLETVVLPLLTLLMRRHLLKFHLCLRQNIEEQELDDDSDTVTWVTNAAWVRFESLRGNFALDQPALQEKTFDWFSAGLFRNYFKWDNWENPGWMKEQSDSVSKFDSRGVDIRQVKLKKVKDSDFRHILNYPKQSVSVDLPSPEKFKPSEPFSDAISGLWYGFEHVNGLSSSPMICLKLRATDNKTEDQKGLSKIVFDGLYDDSTIDGSIDVEGSNFKIEFNRITENGENLTYIGDISVEKGILSGTYIEGATTYSFFLKRLLDPSAMCFRPLKSTLNAKELWTFACQSVLNSVQRRQVKVSPERFASIRRRVELRHIDTPSEEERAETHRLQRIFTPPEYKEIIGLAVWWYNAWNVNSYMCCAVCKDTIFRSRAACLDCPDDDILCQKPECIDALHENHEDNHVIVKRRDPIWNKDYPALRYRAQHCQQKAISLYRGHGPEDAAEGSKADGHEKEPSLTNGQQPTLAQIDRQPVFNKIKKAEVEEAVDNNEEEEEGEEEEGDDEDEDVDNDESYQSSVSSCESGTSEDAARLNCRVCSKRIAAPCWACLECPGGAFVCDNCEKVIDEMPAWKLQARYHQETPDSKKADQPTSDDEPLPQHNVRHFLVRITVNSVTSKALTEAEQRKMMDEIANQRFAAIQEKFSAIEGRFGDLEERMSVGMQRLEALLHQIIASEPNV
ncbi:hypothetical protein C8J56DRAFT_1170874 [Mycena floridula]|nr:hypothetical protein C8J56DRAFT_1170874 [Mycena floridula]